MMELQNALLDIELTIIIPIFHSNTNNFGTP